MKKFTTILTFLALILIGATTLYVFDIPPLNQSRVNQWLAKDPNSQTSPDQNNLNDPNTPTAPISFSEHIKKGDTFLSQGLNDLAIKEYEAANKEDPNNPLPLVKIGELHFKNNNYEKAQLSFETALKQTPDSQNTKILLALTLTAQRKVPEAEELFSTIEATDELSTYYKALFAILSDNHDQAKELLNSISQTDPATPISTKAQKFLAAYKEFDSFQSGSPSHLKTLLARSLTQVEEYNMAIPLLFEVIREKNDYRDAWILLGYSYLKTNRYNEAIDALNEAKKLDPQKAETLFFLGLSYLGQDDLDNAATSLEDAVENGFEPKIQAEQRLAEIYALQKQYRKAVEKYENVLSLNDSDVNYFVKPIWIYLDELHEPSKAYSLAQTAIRKHPNSAMSHNLLGWVNIERDNLEIAHQNLRTAIQLNPNFDAAYYNLGQLYEKENQLAQAKESYKKAYELGKGNQIAKQAAEKFKLVTEKESENLNDTFKASTINQ